MNYNTSQYKQSQQHLKSNYSKNSFPSQKYPNTISINQLQFQISQYDNQSDIKDKSIHIQTSFAQQISQQKTQHLQPQRKPTESKQITQTNRKQLINKFLANVPKINSTTLQQQLSKMHNLQQTKKQSEQFILNFNKQPKEAIKQLRQKLKSNKKTVIIPHHQSKLQTMKLAFKKKLVPSKIVESQNINFARQQQQFQSKSIAQYLLKMQGLDKTVLGQYFGKNDKQILLIFHQYCSLLDFRQKDFDQALRDLLSKFRLPGQSQQIQRIIWEFSQSFYQQNKNAADNPDQLFPLAYSIIMLATDAHNPKQQNKMTVEDFVKNTQRACPSTKKQYLAEIYKRIISKKLQTSVSSWELSYARLKDVNSLQNVKQDEQRTKQLQNGLVMLKACRDNLKLPFSSPKQSKLVQRKIFLSEDKQRINWVKDPSTKDQQPRFIDINDITDFTLGIDSQMLKQKKFPIQFDSVFFTINTNQRSLHLKAKNSKQRSLWINYLRVIMIKKRQQRIKDQQDYQKQILQDEAIQEAWNEDIFPHWDQYWDFKLKKPKKKSYFARGIDALCGCFQLTQNKKQEQEQQHHQLGIPIKNNLLQTLWKYGLPSNGRKILWAQMIGNSFELNDVLVQDIKNRKIKSEKLRNFRINTIILKDILGQNQELQIDYKHNFSKQKQINQKVSKIQQIIYQTTQSLLTFRPDIPHLNDLLFISKVFYDVLNQDKQNKYQKSNLSKQKSMKKIKQQQLSSSVLMANQKIKKLQKQTKIITNIQNKSSEQMSYKKSIICMINLIHKHHFLAFYRGDKIGMRARFSLFDKLLQINAKSVLDHFESIKLQTKMYLVSWFLSVFAGCFQGQFLWRIWDNYLLQEQLYLFKVGISIVKYFEIQLKMATFAQSLDLLKKPRMISGALFFNILQNEIVVDDKLYEQQIQSIKYGRIKDNVNQIPLQ